MPIPKGDVVPISDCSKCKRDLDRGQRFILADGAVYVSIQGKGEEHDNYVFCLACSDTFKDYFESFFENRGPQSVMPKAESIPTKACSKCGKDVVGKFCYSCYMKG